MNKQEYLRIVKQQMSHLDMDTSLEIMTEIIRTFDEKTAKGYSEREIIDQLGNPSKLISSFQHSPSQSTALEVQTDVDEIIEPGDDKTSLTEDPVTFDVPSDEERMDTPSVSAPVTSETGNTGAIVRFLLGLMIGLPILLVLFSIALAGIAVAVFAFLQGLIMTFDLPYQIWQFPFTIREDFSLLVGIGLIMVGSGLITLFISALIGIYHGFKNLLKGNFRSNQ